MTSLTISSGLASPRGCDTAMPAIAAMASYAARMDPRSSVGYGERIEILRDVAASMIWRSGAVFEGAAGGLGRALSSGRHEGSRRSRSGGRDHGEAGPSAQAPRRIEERSRSTRSCRRTSPATSRRERAKAAAKHKMRPRRHRDREGRGGFEKEQERGERARAGEEAARRPLPRRRPSSKRPSGSTRHGLARSRLGARRSTNVRRPSTPAGRRKGRSCGPRCDAGTRIERSDRPAPIGEIGNGCCGSSLKLKRAALN